MLYRYGLRWRKRRMMRTREQGHTAALMGWFLPIDYSQKEQKFGFIVICTVCEHLTAAQRQRIFWRYNTDVIQRTIRKSFVNAWSDQL